MKVSSKVLQKESGPVFCTADSWGGREKSGEGGVSSWPSSRLWTEAQSASCAELVSCPHLELNLTVQSTRESQSFLGQLRTAADVYLNPSHLTGYFCITSVDLGAVLENGHCSLCTAGK